MPSWTSTHRPALGAAAALILAGLAAGCSMAPRYQRPASPASGGFRGRGGAAPAAQPGPAAAPATPAAALGWRNVFPDARLQGLIGVALERNRDLRIAAANVDQVRGQYQIQRAQRLPTVTASGAVTRQRIPADLTSSGRAATTDTWQAGLGLASFELDLFGRVKSLSDAALEVYLGTEASQRTLQISLVAEVATADLTARALDEQAALARATLDALTSSRHLVRRATEAGRVSDLDLATADAQVEAARVTVAQLEQQRDRAWSALQVLAGGPIPPEVPTAGPFDGTGVMAAWDADVPSEVLLERPDVLAAEHALKAANASIGAARAAFFPRIALTGSGGTASADLGGLFQGGSQIWTFTPSITVPIFAGGANVANLDVAEARKRVEIARYEKAILNAFRDVADALAARQWVGQQLEAQTARVEAEQRRFDLAERRYRAGADSYLTLLQAQRDLYAAKSGLIQSRLLGLTSLVDL